jgi:HAD superfamily hydrolase (TIGR01549 family)
VGFQRFDPAGLRAVLFDLDGVLVHSYEIWFHVMNDVAHKLGAEPISRAAFAESWGQGVVADVERFFPMATVQELVRLYDAAFPARLDHLEVDAEAPGVFAALRRAGLAVAVITNTPADLARELVARAGVAPDVLVGGTDVPHPKPAPDMVLLACERLGVAPAAALVVGDSKHDLASVRAAGSLFAGMGMEGDVRIERLGELPARLGIAEAPSSG